MPLCNCIGGPKCRAGCILQTNPIPVGDEWAKYFQKPGDWRLPALRHDLTRFRPKKR